MLWFNSEKDLGAILTEEGLRIEVPGAAFAPGELPEGRCAGAAIEFRADAEHVSGILFVPDPNPRRARLRRSR
jgi:hypothetical protein